jgi:hypothetical protein
MLLQYNDESPNYTSPEEVVMDLYATPEDYKDRSQFAGSMSDMVKAASYGRLILPKAKGKTVTVNMGTNWRDLNGCPYLNISMDAMKKVKDQHPDVDPDKFSFREFFVPRWQSSEDSCKFDSLAILGCGHPELLPRPPGFPGCLAWYRSPGPFVRAHELGHNLGLENAGGNGLGNGWRALGDMQAAMGAGFNFSAFTVSARHQMGWLSEKAGEITECDIKDGNYSVCDPVKLGSMSLPLDHSRYVGMKMRCQQCVPKVSKFRNETGGNIWVSYHGKGGYSEHSSAGIVPQYQNKVIVHLARPWRWRNQGMGSELWAALGAREFYKPDGFGHTIYVCSVADDAAVVSIGPNTTAAQQRCPAA